MYVETTGRSALQVSGLRAGPHSAGGSSVPDHVSSSPRGLLPLLDALLSTWALDLWAVFRESRVAASRHWAARDSTQTASPRGTAPIPRLGSKELPQGEHDDPQGEEDHIALVGCGGAGSL